MIIDDYDNYFLVGLESSMMILMIMIVVIDDKNLLELVSIKWARKQLGGDDIKKCVRKQHHDDDIKKCVMLILLFLTDFYLLDF